MITIAICALALLFILSRIRIYRLETRVDEQQHRIDQLCKAAKLQLEWSELAEDELGK